MSKPSYDSIDYSLRPAKSIERKMLAEMLRRLDRVAALRHYCYIGFGSPYFVDFALFHRALDIQKMISIEREVTDLQRFEFNKPFASIEMIYGESSEALAKLDWSERVVIWLDYDDPLDVSMLNDIAQVVNFARSGSVLFLSCSAELNRDPDERMNDIRERLEDNVPPELVELAGWDAAKLYQKIVNERIEVAVRDRNVGKTASSAVHYSQLINFEYADGAKMVTVGGLLVDGADESYFSSCGFGDFVFYRQGADAYRIRVPKLTPKEVRHLDSMLPASSSVDATDVGIPLSQSNVYSAIYRYFPRYVDVEG